MEVPRFDDNECVSALGRFLRAVLGTVQISFMLFMLFIGSVFGGLSAVCIQTWDRGMDMLGRKRVVMDSTGAHVHFIRYYLLFRDGGASTDFNVFVHRIVRTDEGDMHDHPWGYSTFILSGGYWETTGTAKRDAATEAASVGGVERKWRGPGFMQRVGESHVHRLGLGKNSDTGADVPCWTLFVPFRRTQEWGFYTERDDGVVWESAAKHLGGAKETGPGECGDSADGVQCEVAAQDAGDVDKKND